MKKKNKKETRVEDTGFGYSIPEEKKPFTTFLKSDFLHHLRLISVYLCHHTSQVFNEYA